MCFKARSKARKVPGFFPYLTTIAVQCIVSQSIESCRSAIGQPHTHPIRVALHPPRASLDDAHEATSTLHRCPGSSSSAG